jgi:hypothetical protein
MSEMSQMSETTPRRCHGYCGLPIPAEKGTTYTVIGPDGTLREFCDGDCLGTYYLGASREGEAQARLARLVRALEGAARTGPVDVVITRLMGGPWTCELSAGAESGPDGGHSGVAAAGTGETLAAAIAAALARGADA